MTFFFIVMGAVVIGLFIYLMVALLKPEIFP